LLINRVFGFLVIISIIIAIFTGKVSVISVEAVTAAGEGVKKVFGLIGILTLWLGVAKIAERSGLLKIITGVLHPLVGWLFPTIPKGHPAMGAILMNLTANMFGFGSAATPFGLKAMEELQRLNRNRYSASEAMCTFLVINATSITFMPSTIIALRINAGSANPMEIVGTTFFASCVSTCVAITADYCCRVYYRRRGRI